MEQKQLDELDESYFGDEFIEEDSVVITPAKIEPKTESKDTSTEKATKKASKKETKKVAKKETKSAKATKKAAKEEKKTVAKEPETKQGSEVKEAMEKDEKTVDVSSPVNPWKGEAKAEKAVKAESKPETKTEATEPVKEVSTNEHMANDGSGFFRETSTWKAISGIILILLVFSVFTQGFQFSENAVTGNAVADLTLVQAENKVLDFVNTNLLQAPFQATVISSEDVGNLYKVTLSIAGQQVDSYLTKDGQTFFPQGIDTSISLVPTDDPSVVELEQTEDTMQETQEEVVEETTEETSVEPEPIEEPVSEVSEPTTETTPVGMAEPKSFTLVSKKWSFTPDVVRVQQGDVVRLTISPNTDNPTFALNQFTFGVPELNVEQEVNGNTVIEFTADQAGSFPFTCTSCESWRGMSGTLVVE